MGKTTGFPDSPAAKHRRMSSEHRGGQAKPGTHRFTFGTHSFDIPVDAEGPVTWEYFPPRSLAPPPSPTPTQLVDTRTTPLKVSRISQWRKLRLILLGVVLGVWIGQYPRVQRPFQVYIEPYLPRILIHTEAPPPLTQHEKYPLQTCGFTEQDFSFLDNDLYVNEHVFPQGVTRKAVKKWNRDLKGLWHPDKVAVTGLPKYVHEYFTLKIDEVCAGKLGTLAGLDSDDGMPKWENPFGPRYEHLFYEY